MERVFLEMFDTLKGPSSGDNRILGFISRTTGQLCAGTILPAHCNIQETLLMTMQLLHLKRQVDGDDGGKLFRFAEDDPANPFSGAEVLSDNAEQDLGEPEPEPAAPSFHWLLLCQLVLRLALDGLIVFFLLSTQPLFAAAVFVFVVLSGLPTVFDLYFRLRQNLQRQLNIPA